jgi:hypothetical protein
MGMSSYDRWKTTDPNDSYDELYEAMEETYWSDVHQVKEDLKAFALRVIDEEFEYIESLPPNHLASKEMRKLSCADGILKEFSEVELPYIIESMIEAIED